MFKKVFLLSPRSYQPIFIFSSDFCSFKLVNLTDNSETFEDFKKGEWDEETGQYIGANAAKANKMTKALRSRWGFRKNQINKQTAIKDDLTDIGKFKQKAAQQHQAQQQQMEQDRQGGQNPSAQTFRDAPGGLSQAQSRAARGDPKGTGGGWKWEEGGRVGFK